MSMALAPAAMLRMPSATMAWARMVDVVVPSRLDSTDMDLLRKLKENRARDARAPAWVICLT